MALGSPSWRTTRSTISCSCERSKSLIVLRLIVMSRSSETVREEFRSLASVEPLACGKKSLAGGRAEVLRFG